MPPDLAQIEMEESAKSWTPLGNDASEEGGNILSGHGRVLKSTREDSGGKISIDRLHVYAIA